MEFFTRETRFLNCISPTLHRRDFRPQISQSCNQLRLSYQCSGQLVSLRELTVHHLQLSSYLPDRLCGITQSRLERFERSRTCFFTDGTFLLYAINLLSSIAFGNKNTSFNSRLLVHEMHGATTAYIHSQSDLSFPNFSTQIIEDILHGVRTILGLHITKNR